MTFRKALVAATFLALPVMANAQALNGIYVGGAAGVNMMSKETLNVYDPVSKTGIQGNLAPALGGTATVSAGYGFGNGFRAELEGAWYYNGISSNNAGGNEQKYGFFVNGLYDFVGVVPGVTPYAGLGVGYVEANYRNFHVKEGANSFTYNNSTEGSFAYQAIVGVAVPVPGVPGLSLTADYRFMGLSDTRSLGSSGSLVLNGGAPKAATITSSNVSNNFNNSVLVGVRYAFGVTPPPPPPAPAPVPAAAASRSYLVFFDWDKAVLTDRAKAIVAEAAANSKKVATTKIEVNGYTDTSGTASYNMGLSVRRAQAVAAELVKDGVPKQEIMIHGFGETHPLVPTGPNVREPQNRRVEIILK